MSDTPYTTAITQIEFVHFGRTYNSKEKIQKKKNLFGGVKTFQLF
jgi:hypothetical protein